METAHIVCPPGLSETEALREVSERLRLVEPIEETLEGGSSARVYFARTEAGEALAVKILVARPGVVDGHDLQSFQSKLDQIRKIKATAPYLGARYLPMLHMLDGGDWACYTTSYYASTDLAAPLREPDGEALFFEQCTAVVEDLFVRGYGADAVVAPPDFLDRIVIRRFLRRLPLLEQALPDALRADELVVNGRRCVAPRLLLPRILGEARSRLDRMRPARLMLCAHGDANTRNILMGLTRVDGAPDFRIIDPRGSTDYWDPVYDLAKCLFSLSVWDPALRLGFTIRQNGSNYDVSYRRPIYAGYVSAIQRFQTYLAGLTQLEDMFKRDPGWQARLLLTHDMHVLSEAPCRLSDRKARQGCDGAPLSPEQLALGFYLMGTLFINDLAAQLMGPGELDAAHHLTLAWA